MLPEPSKGWGSAVRALTPREQQFLETLARVREPIVAKAETEVTRFFGRALSRVDGVLGPDDFGHCLTFLLDRFGFGVLLAVPRRRQEVFPVYGAGLHLRAG